MKNALNCFTVSLMLLLIYSCSNNQYRISGTVDPEFNGQMAVLTSYNDLDSLIYSDSTIIKDGKFNFKGKELLEGFTKIRVKSDDKYLYSELFLEHGDIVLNLGEDEYKSRLSGTLFNELYQTYIDSSNYFIVEVNKHEVRIGNAFVITPGTEAADIWLGYGAYMREFKSDNINNIVGKSEFLSSIARGAEFYYKNVNKLSFNEMYDFLDSAMLNHPKVIKYLEEEQNRAIIAQEQKFIGSRYTDFELFTPSDAAKQLSDYIGKKDYVFLEFWASWCGPCIASIPALKEIYAEHSDKLEIISISLDTDQTSWTDAMKAQNMPWPQLADLKAFDSDIAKWFGIKGIPFGVLVDKDGVIVDLSGAAGLKFYMQNK